MVLPGRKALTATLKTDLLKLNILDLTGIVSEYTTVRSSNVILGSINVIVSKHAFQRKFNKY